MRARQQLLPSYAPGFCAMRQPTQKERRAVVFRSSEDCFHGRIVAHLRYNLVAAA
jgi:hypothetical protein